MSIPKTHAPRKLVAVKGQFYLHTERILCGFSSLGRSSQYIVLCKRRSHGAKFPAELCSKSRKVLTLMYPMLVEA